MEVREYSRPVEITPVIIQSEILGIESEIRTIEGMISGIGDSKKPELVEIREDLLLYVSIMRMFRDYFSNHDKRVARTPQAVGIISTYASVYGNDNTISDPIVFMEDLVDNNSEKKFEGEELDQLKRALIIAKYDEILDCMAKIKSRVEELGVELIRIYSPPSINNN